MNGTVDTYVPYELTLKENPLNLVNRLQIIINVG